MSGMRPATLLDSFEAAVHKIAATATMDMDVDEAGANPPTLGINCLSTLGDAILRLSHVRNLAISADHNGVIDGPVGQNGFSASKAEAWQRVFLRIDKGTLFESCDEER